jgi:cold shock CspA family protein
VPPDAFRSSGLRKLTLGQRVRFRVEGEGDGARVTYVNILTLPDPF